MGVLYNRDKEAVLVETGGMSRGNVCADEGSLESKITGKVNLSLFILH